MSLFQLKYVWTATSPSPALNLHLFLHPADKCDFYRFVGPFEKPRIEIVIFIIIRKVAIRYKNIK